MEKTAVLPVPDWDWAMTSLPRNMGRMARCWMADGRSSPCAYIPRSKEGLRLRSSKDCAGVVSDTVAVFVWEVALFVDDCSLSYSLWRCFLLSLRVFGIVNCLALSNSVRFSCSRAFGGNVTARGIVQ